MNAAAIALGAALGALIAGVFMLARLVAGPTLHDRILAAHAFTQKAALVIAALALAASPGLLDAALALLFADFVLAVAALKFLRYRTLQTPLART